LPPLKVAIVARMLWSKGIDLAVEAVRLARAHGADVELSLHGAPDPSNPKAVPEETLRGWSAQPGITWHGPTRDAASVWRDHHIACLPSRGGEGLPRTLLEAAACGRAILTTDVPGCRTLVRDGVEGFVVPPDHAQALADALIGLAADPARVAEMGEAARARVLAGFTERHVMEAVKGLYVALLRG
jgi:glycosyltransferase involved in cell wall biosynthesis